MTLNEAAVLVVDDEPALREIFTQWLALAGCPHITTAADGEEALALLKANSYDLLITDVRMPKMDGISLIRQLGQAEGSIPSIIFVSGFGDVDEREMYGLGVEAFLAKPLHRAELVNIMEKALADRTALWLTPMTPPPRQSVVINTAGFDCRPETTQTEAMEKSYLCLGHGGFSASYSGPLSVGKVAFCCNFPQAQHRQLSGQGIVRWYSRAEQAVGIEFLFIDPSCRSWLLQELAATNPRSFIPVFSRDHARTLQAAS